MQTARATQSGSTKLLLKASSNSLSESRKGRQRVCCADEKHKLQHGGEYGLFSICPFICFRQQRIWLMPLSAAFGRFLKLHWSAWQRGNYRSEWKSFDKQNFHISREKRFGASSYTCCVDLPPGTSVCTILNFPPLWLSWKHFSSLRAYLFIDCPKGGLHHS